MSRLQHLKDTGMAWALGLGLLALGAVMDQREDEMTNLNTPTLDQGPLTADDLAAWRREHAPRCCNDDCDQGRQCPMRMPAEAATEIGADQRGKHREGLLSGLWLRIRRALT